MCWWMDGWLCLCAYTCRHEIRTTYILTYMDVNILPATYSAYLCAYTVLRCACTPLLCACAVVTCAST